MSQPMPTTICVCPECGATLRADPDRGETVCSECATVTSETAIDRGSEWQAFTPRETAERSRVGAPLTATRHDRGLSTEISWQDKDARGNQLSARKRRQMQRLRKWNKRCQAYSTKEQNLRDGLGEIDRMASALGLPQSVRETASILYRRAQDNELLYGRSVEGATAASLYAAARQEGIPRTLDEIAAVAQVGRQRIATTYRTIAAELELAVKLTDPRAYLPRFASELDCSNETSRSAHHLLAPVVSTAYTGGKNPVSLAAAALYAGSQLTEETITQQEISDVTDISCETIRTHYQDLLDRYRDEARDGADRFP